jgi:hypothetical protein
VEQANSPFTVIHSLQFVHGQPILKYPNTKLYEEKQ